MITRRPKLTPAIQKSICDRIRLGNYNNVAAVGAGIGESTFYLWLQKGRAQESGAYRDFLNAVEQAQAEAEMRNVAQIQAATRDNWMAAAWWLERKFSKRWGRRVEITSSEVRARAAELAKDYGLDPEEMVKLAEQIASGRT